MNATYDLMGYKHAPMIFDPVTRILKHDINYLKGTTHIKETNVVILHYTYSDLHWTVYKPNNRGKMAVCIQFEGKYYLLVQSPRTLDRIFSFLQMETLKGQINRSKIKKWQIRYPQNNEKIEDWLKEGSVSIYSHHDFTCMLTWYLNNLWLFDGLGVSPTNKILSFLRDTRIIKNETKQITNNINIVKYFNSDFHSWRKNMDMINNQYKESVRAILEYDTYHCILCENQDAVCMKYIRSNYDQVIAIEVLQKNKVNEKECITYNYYNWRNFVTGTTRIYEKNLLTTVEWSAKKDITKFDYIKNVLKIVTAGEKIKEGIISQCIQENHVPLPPNYQYSSTNEQLKELVNQDRRTWVTNILAVNQEYKTKIRIVPSESEEKICLQYGQRGCVNFRYLGLCDTIFRQAKYDSNLFKSHNNFNHRILQEIKSFKSLHYNKIIAPLPPNYYYSSTKEQLKDFYQDREELNEIIIRRNWINKMKKINQEISNISNSNYSNKFNQRLYAMIHHINYINGNAVCDRILDGTISYDIIRNFITSREIPEILPKNYIYTHTKEQLREMYINNKIYKTITTYIDF